MVDFRIAIQNISNSGTIKWSGQPFLVKKGAKSRVVARLPDESSKRKEISLTLDRNLSSRAAVFHSALSSAAENNETMHCQRNFQSSIESLRRHSNLALRQCHAVQESLDAIEARVDLAASSCQISSLKMRLAQASSLSQIEQLIDDVERLESKLAAIPSPEEIRSRALHARIPNMLMDRSLERAKDGATRLRRSLDRAEIAWIEHVDDAASRLFLE